jgi:hypothetical protein
MAQSGGSLMLIDYSDIWKRISIPPLWWFNGVPRYETFHPKWLTGSEAALVHSQCSTCGTDFMIGLCSPYPPHVSLSKEIERFDTLWLSDPPLVFCCQGGHATSSTAVTVIEFWRRFTGEEPLQWYRVPEFEKELAKI